MEEVLLNYQRVVCLFFFLFIPFFQLIPWSLFFKEAHIIFFRGREEEDYRDEIHISNEYEVRSYRTA
jgi:hypothetical protein